LAEHVLGCKTLLRKRTRLVLLLLLLLLLRHQDLESAESHRP
jgi:hypothetical protein